MRLENGKYRCVLCQQILSVPAASRPRVIISAASGRPTMRVITYEGREIHRCPVREPLADRPATSWRPF
jgi:hypothetical protein